MALMQKVSAAVSTGMEMAELRKAAGNDDWQQVSRIGGTTKSKEVADAAVDLAARAAAGFAAMAANKASSPEDHAFFGQLRNEAVLVITQIENAGGVGAAHARAVRENGCKPKAATAAD